MGLINDMKNVFSLEGIVVYERIKIVESSFEIEVGQIPAFEDIIAIITQAPQRDTFKMDFKLDSDDILSFNNKSITSLDMYEEFLRFLSTDSNIRVNILIEKEVEGNTFSIYASGPPDR